MRKPRLRVHSFAISVDGYGAGPDQSLEHPMGTGGMALHEWALRTRGFHQMLGKEGGTTGLDDRYMAEGFSGIGAWILGRNMFGPIRGDWLDEEWRGWWGTNPPYHMPVFVLTHFPRAPIEMEGGTSFHFVTEGFEAALERAREAAGGKDIRVGGGASTIRQYLGRGLIDLMHLAVTPVLLGCGEPLLAGLDLPALGYRVTRKEPGEDVLHVTIERNE
jgi:dihydrofolate reductase